jgi:hypothetical protein
MISATSSTVDRVLQLGGPGGAPPLAEEPAPVDHLVPRVVVGECGGLDPSALIAELAQRCPLRLLHQALLGPRIGRRGVGDRGDLGGRQRAGPGGGGERGQLVQLRSRRQHFLGRADRRARLPRQLVGG